MAKHESRRMKRGGIPSTDRSSAVSVPGKSSVERKGWENALDEFAKRVREAYNGGLDKLVLYGSRARGTAGDDSDVDVLVVLNELDDFWSELSRLHALSDSICLEHEVVLSALPVDKKEFDDPKTPLLLNARREGRPWDDG